jgi:hypothetical protein
MAGPDQDACGCGTCEIFISTFADTVSRRFDADVGLNVFDC